MEDEDEQLEKSVQKQLKLFQEKTNVEETVRSFIENNSKLEENNFKNNQADFSIAFDIKKPIDDKFSFIFFNINFTFIFRKGRNFFYFNFL